MEGESYPADPSSVPNLSSIANSVLRRCSRILYLSMGQLHQSFEAEVPEHFKQPTCYARNLVEYCSYRALRVQTQSVVYLSDKEFSLLTFDMMLAWEAPDTETESLPDQNACSNHPEVDDDEGSLFYASATETASQIDGKKTVGLEAFARISPACAAVADSLTVHNLFDALTSSSGGRLHFLIYDKYLKGLCMVLKSMNNISGQSQRYKFDLGDGEIVLDIDAKSVVQHSGTSTKSGRLTLTSHALYFEASGVASYHRATMYDLSRDLKQVVKRELTGPWGARLFDKAIMCKSDAIAEPIFLEFPKFSGHSQRDYWYAIIQEVLHVHKFIRKYNLTRFRRAEALSIAALGIFRYRAVKEAFHSTPSDFKSILAFNLAEKLPKGDNILKVLYDQLEVMQLGFQNRADLVNASEEEPLAGPLPDSLYFLTRMGFLVLKNEENPAENDSFVSNLRVGRTCPRQTAVKESLSYSNEVEAARATLYQVKMVDIDTNLAVIKNLLFPVTEMGKFLQFLASCGWIVYTIPCLFLSLAIYMLWNKNYNDGNPVQVSTVSPPPRRNPVELLMTLHDGVSLLQTNVQSSTIALLKLRALLLAIPETTNNVAIALIIAAVALALLPFRYVFILVLLEAYTRRMPLRKESSDVLVRRIKEWWSLIPAAPIQIVRSEES